MGSNGHVLFAQCWDKIPAAEIRTDPSLLVLILDKWQKSFYPSNLFPWLKGCYFLAFIVFIQRDHSGFSRGRWSLSTNAEGWGSWTLGLLYHHLTICPVNTCQVRCGTSGSKKTAYNNSLSLFPSLFIPFQPGTAWFCLHDLQGERELFCTVASNMVIISGRTFHILDVQRKWTQANVGCN